MLEEERRYFDEHLEEWLNRFAGRVVLVKGQELIGSFDDEDDALAEGARRFGRSSFLVRRVIPEQEKVSAPALTLGLISANPPRTVLS